MKSKYNYKLVFQIVMRILKFNFPRETFSQLKAAFVLFL